MTGIETSARRPTMFGVVAFKFGPGAPEFIEHERAQFYEQIALSVAENAVHAVESPNERTLAIDLANVSTAGMGSVRERMRARRAEWSEQPELLIIDMMFGRHRTVPGRVPLQIAVDMVFLSAEFADKLTVLLVDSLPPPGDPVRRICQALIDDGRLLVVDRDTNSAGTRGQPTDFTDCYALLDRMAIDEATKRLGRKMIRRLGHFQRPLGDSHECMRFFYDGEECTREIALLIAHHALAMQPLPRLVLFDCTVSTWLAKAVRDACIELHAIPLDVRDVLENPSNFANELGEPALLVMPLVDTGSTVETLYARWREAGIAASFPPLLSVLSTARYTDAVGGVRQINCGERDLAVSYFLTVDRGLEVIRPCRMCELGIPVSDFEIEKYEMLTAFDFWNMVDETGWKDEDGVPSIRKSVGHVPSFANMFAQNGAWLAKKALTRIRASLGIAVSAEAIVLVASDEPGARALAENIALLHEAAMMILIPPADVDRCRHDDADIESLLRGWQTAQPGWHAQLCDSQPLVPIVFVEEFTVTGATCRAVVDIVRSHRRAVKGHTLICDFNPSRGLRSADVPRLPLYEFDTFSLARESA